MHRDGTTTRSRPTSHRYLLAEELLPNYAKDLGYESADAARDAVDQRIVGSDLRDVTYDRLFDYYADAATWGTERAWRILVDDYVTTGDGTGIVHQAPAYGEDDQRITEAAGIPLIMSLDDGGRFLPQVTDVAGELWMDANTPLVRILRQDGRLLRLASYEHSYPHCWRCRNPLIYKAVSSWFVRVTAIKDRLIENNEQITWVPENVKHGQFGKWLEGARDWSISRNRYWGSPIPVWKSDDPEYPRVDVYGSLEDIERDFGRLPRNAAGEVDLHRPYIDDLTRPNPDDPTGRSTMRRIEDVLDVWFDSASMPYAQVHYPFENHDWFDEHSPADFIVEYIGQTRGWFYVMHVLSTALFDRPAFTGVSCHGIVLGSDGLKMSKSLQNYPDVSRGVRPRRLRRDALVPHVVERAARREPRRHRGGHPRRRAGVHAAAVERVVLLRDVRERGRRPRRRAGYEAILAHGFHRRARPVHPRPHGRPRPRMSPPTSRVSTRRWRRPSSASSPRRSRTGTSAARATGSGSACRMTRRSREAFDTLYTVLETLTRVAAPLIPLVSERVWQGLTGGRSVHLADWPDADAFPAADDIRTAMDAVREVSSVANALRKKEGKRVRLPLPRLTVVMADAASLGQFEGILRDELNVKSVELSSSTGDVAERYGISKRLTVNARAVGTAPRQAGAARHRRRARRASGRSEDGGVVVDGDLAARAASTSSPRGGRGRRRATALALLRERRLRPARHDDHASSSKPRASRATSSAPCRTPARRPASTSATASACELAFDEADDRVAVESAFEVADVAGETLAVEHSLYGPRGSRPAKPEARSRGGLRCGRVRQLAARSRSP